MTSDTKKVIVLFLIICLGIFCWDTYAEQQDGKTARMECYEKGGDYYEGICMYETAIAKYFK